jgi:hypothetical protein
MIAARASSAREREVTVNLVSRPQFARNSRVVSETAWRCRVRSGIELPGDVENDHYHRHCRGTAVRISSSCFTAK